MSSQSDNYIQLINLAQQFDWSTNASLSPAPSNFRKNGEGEKS